MTARASDAAAPMFPPGVYTETFHGRQVFYAYRGDGCVVEGAMVPIGGETEDDIIVALADAVAAGAHRPPLGLVAGGPPSVALPADAPVSSPLSWGPPRVLRLLSLALLGSPLLLAV